MTELFLRPIDWGTFGIVLGIVAVLAVVFAVLIILVSKFCAVKEDEKAVAAAEKLAGANCGGCGFAGCSDFAKALSEGRADLSMCGPTSAENKMEIARILGINYSAQEEVFAVVKCSGGMKGIDKYKYTGNGGCTAQSLCMGGSKVCAEGCLGGGTCVESCQYGAIKIVEGVTVINKALCEACGVCVKNCPKHLIELIPESAKIYVACSSSCKGKEAMSNCKFSCISCGLCVKNCAEGAITMVNNIPVIDYSKCTGCLTCLNKCPRKCIKRL